MDTNGGEDGDDDSSLLMRTDIPGTVLSIQHAPCNTTEMGYFCSHCIVKKMSSLHITSKYRSRI